MLIQMPYVANAMKYHPSLEYVNH